MCSADDPGPGLAARTSPYVNPFAPIYPSMPLSQFLGRGRQSIDGLLRMGRPGKLDAGGWDCQGTMDLRYDRHDVAVALRLRQDPHRYGVEDWQRWRRRVAGPAGHLTAEEAAAYAGFSGRQPAHKIKGDRWRWPPGVLQAGRFPKGWLLAGAFDASKHELHVWRAD